MRGFLCDGASRTRTGDHLGAIQEGEQTGWTPRPAEQAGIRPNRVAQELFLLEDSFGILGERDEELAELEAEIEGDSV
jgi:hypothetical protein